MSKISTKTSEESILADFLLGYNKRFGIELMKKIPRDKPDFEVIDPRTDEIIGIEVTSVYQNAVEAKIQYGKDRNWDIITGSSN
jgi:hypothetical protein